MPKLLLKSFVVVFIAIILLTVGVSVFLTLNNPQKTKFGIAGYSPVSFPNSSIDQVEQYFNELNKYANTYGIHAKLDNAAGIITLASKYFAKDIVLVVDYNDAKNYQEIVAILKRNPKIKYLSLGNEVNLIEFEDKAKINEFVDDYKIAYKYIKDQFPSLKVFTVFQYEALIGKSKISGKGYTENINLINEFLGYIDLIGITSYPYFDYKSPADLTDNYFGQLDKFNLKIGITETSWPSAITGFESGVEYINSSESEQLDYLTWLNSINLTHIEFINWLFLNDLNQSNKIFEGSALRDLNGNPKLGFSQWENLLN